MKIRLTQRDLELMRWINGFGFLEVGQIAEKFSMSPVTAYARLRKLVTHAYLTHDRVLHGKPGAYRVTAEGTAVAGDVLSPLKKVSLATYDHDMKVAEVSLALGARFQGEFIPERRLRREVGIRGVGHRGHVSDGVFYHDGKRIAIEVELSLKGKRRREKIYRHYLKQFDFQGVWYFCGNKEIERKMQPLAEKARFIHVFSLADFLKGGSQPFIFPSEARAEFNRSCDDTG